jgi:hypothetical protein
VDAAFVRHRIIQQRVPRSNKEHGMCLQALRVEFTRFLLPVLLVVVLRFFLIASTSLFQLRPPNSSRIIQQHMQRNNSPQQVTES